MTPLDARLTDREEEAADLLADGLTDKEIADRLRISLSMASKHVARVIGKLGAGSRTEAAVRWDRTRREGAAK